MRVVSVVLSVCLGAALLVNSSGCEPQARATAVSDGERRGAEPPPVRVAAVEVAASHRTVELVGVTRMADQARLAFTMPGRLVERLVELGDVVAKDAAVARIDPLPLKHRLSAAKATARRASAQVAQAKRDLARAKRLLKLNATTAEEVEQRATALRTARAMASESRAQRREAKRSLDEGVLRAPYAGVVSHVLAEPGEVLGAGAPVVIVSAANSAVEVELKVPEAWLAHLTVGQSVRVDLPLLGKKAVTGTIHRVTPHALGAGRLFPVVVRLKADAIPRLRSGATARVTLLLPTTPALRVPAGAVVEPLGQHPRVAVVRKDGQMTPIPVRIVGVDGASLRVISDALAVGDAVVVSGHGAMATATEAATTSKVEVER